MGWNPNYLVSQLAAPQVVPMGQTYVDMAQAVQEVQLARRRPRRRR